MDHKPAACNVSPVSVLPVLSLTTAQTSATSILSGCEVKPRQRLLKEVCKRGLPAWELPARLHTALEPAQLPPGAGSNGTCQLRSLSLAPRGQRGRSRGLPHLISMCPRYQLLQLFC